jgi:hypothetical protein
VTATGKDLRRHLPLRQRQAVSAARPSTERRPTLTDNATGVAGEWVACHCCGRSFPAANTIRFERHPDDAVCVGCAEWLYGHSRPIVRRLHPMWRLPARIRTWLAVTR